MNFTQEQISELMLNIANSENGTNLLIQMTKNSDPYENAVAEKINDILKQECLVLKKVDYKSNNYAIPFS
jgi:hypothetical protein